LTFGLRKLESRGARFYLNNDVVFFRGANEGCQFPLTGYPPTDVDSWKQIFRKANNYGINHIRFHSFCPPEAAFVAADEMGMYLQPEASNWGQYQDPKMAPFLERETRAIIDAFGNHPSFMMISSGNEGGGPFQSPVREWIARWAERDSRRLFTGTTGRPVLRATNTDQRNSYVISIFVGWRAGGGIIRGPAGWYGRDFSRAIANAQVPVISHEIGQWCAYPSFTHFGKYTGFLKPYNYEVFRESLLQAGMLDQADDFTMASGALQVLSYKEEVEQMLRTKGLGGFQMLDLHDFSGQGTAVVGVLDDFWDSKGYVTPEQWRRFCSPVVPLARLSRLTYRSSQEFRAEVEIANFGPIPIEGAKPVWRIVGDDGREIASGVLDASDIPRGNGVKLGTVAKALVNVPAPAHYRLVVGIEGHDEIENDWSFWVYPDQVSIEAPSGVQVVNSWQDAKSALSEGDRVLLLVNNRELGWSSPPLSRTPVFWNVVMNPKWNRSLGMLIRDDHPALAEFPTDSHSNWQWNDVLSRGVRGLNIDALPNELRPIVQPVDEWTRNWRLSMLMEARIGDGRLMICTADLQRDLDRRVAARQLRHSILAYMASDKFDPEVSITPKQLASLFFDTQLMSRLGASGYGISAVVDSNPNTAWTSGFPRRPGRGRSAVPPSDYPHDLTITFAKPVTFGGLRVMDRQNQRAREGDIRDFTFQVSDDGQQWRTVKEGQLKSSWKPQTIELEAPVSARHIRLRAINGYGPSNGAALAELAVIPVTQE
jgi:beta-galactosidase